MILKQYDNNYKFEAAINDYKTYLKENIRFTNINIEKLVTSFEVHHPDTIYIILIPNGACSGCISNLFEETYITNLLKKYIYIISETPNDWIRKELKGRKFEHYYNDSSLFQSFEFKENIVIAKYSNPYKQLHCITYIPQYSEFVEYFLQ